MQKLSVFFIKIGIVTKRYGAINDILFDLLESRIYLKSL